MKYLRLFFFLCVATAAHAQITVSCSLKQRFHMLHEPIIATVNVTNLTGRDIKLSDTPQYQWFGFRVTTDGDRMIPPRNVNYHLPPVTVKAGETIKRSVNLNELYELGESGTFRVQSSIYFDGLDKFFVSRPTHIEVNEGHLIWRKVAGIPEGQPAAGQMRVFTLLSHEVGESNNLYCCAWKKPGRWHGLLHIPDRPPARQRPEPQAEFDSTRQSLRLLGIPHRHARLRVDHRSRPPANLAGRTNIPRAQDPADACAAPPKARSRSSAAKREGSVAQRIRIPVEIPKISDRPPGFPKN